jgi:hypothetical protein
MKRILKMYIILPTNLFILDNLFHRAAIVLKVLIILINDLDMTFYDIEATFETAVVDTAFMAYIAISERASPVLLPMYFVTATICIQ